MRQVQTFRRQAVRRQAARRPAAPAAIAGENVGPDKATGPVVIGLTYTEKALFRGVCGHSRKAAPCRPVFHELR